MTNLFLPLAGEANALTGNNAYTMIIYLVLIVGVFYFFMIRPQKKQEKETKQMRDSLAIGDDVTTIGGIIGRVTHIKEDVVTIETGADRNKIRIRKSAIATIETKKDDKAPKGGYKVKSVKKADEKPALKEDVKPEAPTENK